MCNFKAAELLDKRRQAALDEDVNRGLATIRAIDELRWNHEARTGCKCWDEQREANPNPLESR